jgi:integrase
MIRAGRTPRSRRSPATSAGSHSVRGRERVAALSAVPSATPPSAPRDLALPNVAIPEQLVVRVVEAGKDQSRGDVVTILATTALRISEVSGLRVGDVDLIRGLIHVLRQTYPASSGHGLHLLHQSRVERRDELI